MNSREHIKAAEELLRRSEMMKAHWDRHVARAQVHATLALAVQIDEERDFTRRSVAA